MPDTEPANWTPEFWIKMHAQLAAEELAAAEARAGGKEER